LLEALRWARGQRGSCDWSPDSDISERGLALHWLGAGAAAAPSLCALQVVMTGRVTAGGLRSSRRVRRSVQTQPGHTASIVILAPRLMSIRTRRFARSGIIKSCTALSTLKDTAQAPMRALEIWRAQQPGPARRAR
jgi:hypothetical protein